MRFFGNHVKLHMKSGLILEGYVTRMVKTTDDGHLIKLSWDGTMPFHFSIHEVVAIETKRVINWRRLFMS